LGNYEAMDESLAVLEKTFRADIQLQAEEVEKKFPAARRAPLFVMTFSLSNLLGTLGYNKEYARLKDLRSLLFNVTTLRGIVALEAGDTERARDILTATLNEAGEHRFPDRPVAQRYLDLLNANK